MILLQLRPSHLMFVYFSASSPLHLFSFFRFFVTVSPIPSFLPTMSQWRSPFDFSVGGSIVQNSTQLQLLREQYGNEDRTIQLGMSLHENAHRLKIAKEEEEERLIQEAKQRTAAAHQARIDHKEMISARNLARTAAMHEPIASPNLLPFSAHFARIAPPETVYQKAERRRNRGGVSSRIDGVIPGASLRMHTQKQAQELLQQCQLHVAQQIQHAIPTATSTDVSNNNDSNNNAQVQHQQHVHNYSPHIDPVPSNSSYPHPHHVLGQSYPSGSQTSRQKQYTKNKQHSNLQSYELQPPHPHTYRPYPPQQQPQQQKYVPVPPLPKPLTAAGLNGSRRDAQRTSRNSANTSGYVPSSSSSSSSHSFAPHPYFTYRPRRINESDRAYLNKLDELYPIDRLPQPLLEAQLAKGISMYKPNNQNNQADTNTATISDTPTSMNTPTAPIESSREAAGPVSNSTSSNPPNSSYNINGWSVQWGAHKKKCRETRIQEFLLAKRYI
jgi:hypothetical protein